MAQESPTGAAAAGGHAAIDLPALFIFNPLGYYQTLNHQIVSGPASPSAMGSQRWLTEAWLPFVLVAGLLYLMEKNRVKRILK